MDYLNVNICSYEVMLITFIEYLLFARYCAVASYAQYYLILATILEIKVIVPIL